MIRKRRNGVILRAVEPIGDSEAPRFTAGRNEKILERYARRSADVFPSMEIAFGTQMNHVHGYQKSIEQILQSFLDLYFNSQLYQSNSNVEGF